MRGAQQVLPPTTIKNPPLFSLASVMETKTSAASGTETYQGLNHGFSNDRGALHSFVVYVCICAHNSPSSLSKVRQRRWTAVSFKDGEL